MKRETVFAIGLGILLGVGIGLFVLFQSNSGEQTKVIPVSGDGDENTIVKNVPRESELYLTINQPEDNVVTSSKDITIKAKAKADSLIIIQSQVNTEILKNKQEDFSVTFPLALGENTIHISAYSDSSTPQDTTLKVYYVQE